jgi:hypothetical protein
MSNLVARGLFSRLIPPTEGAGRVGAIDSAAAVKTVE